MTYALGSAGADVVGQTGHIARRAHQDDGLDLAEGRSRDGGVGRGDARAAVGAAADGVVHDLTALHVRQFTMSVCS
jgi:hypothetical protein